MGQQRTSVPQVWLSNHSAMPTHPGWQWLRGRETVFEPGVFPEGSQFELVSPRVNFKESLSNCSRWAGWCFAWFPLPSVNECVCEWVNVMHIYVKHLGLKALYKLNYHLLYPLLCQSPIQEFYCLLQENNNILFWLFETKTFHSSTLSNVTKHLFS